VFNALRNWDFLAFEYVHVKWHNAFLDTVLPFLRNQYFWAPVYIFLAIFMYEHFKQKGLNWILFFVLSFGVGDVISAKLLKPIFGRVRPCIDPYWAEVHRHIVPNSYGKSFPSTHATNHFALSMFIIVTCVHLNPKIKWGALLWASSVAYAQVYVGVHYPLDVLAGALLGIWVGYIMGNYFNAKYNLL
jgi:membrane-associated phospholipid phosphatase